jgi:hypothetical protein
VACPPFSAAREFRWWARRKSAFAHPTSLFGLDEFSPGFEVVEPKKAAVE